MGKSASVSENKESEPKQNNLALKGCQNAGHG